MYEKLLVCNCILFDIICEKYQVLNLKYIILAMRTKGFFGLNQRLLIGDIRKWQKIFESIQLDFIM